MEWGHGAPVHDDIHVAAVPLEAGTQPDLVPPSEAHLHGVVSHHLGVVLQGGLQLQQGFLRLLTAQEKPPAPVNASMGTTSPLQV